MFLSNTPIDREWLSLIVSSVSRALLYDLPGMPVKSHRSWSTSCGADKVYTLHSECFRLLLLARSTIIILEDRLEPIHDHGIAQAAYCVFSHSRVTHGMLFRIFLDLFRPRTSKSFPHAQGTTKAKRIPNTDTCSRSWEFSCRYIRASAAFLGHFSVSSIYVQNRDVFY